ncbi:MAG: dethiobiotin synthase [Planctomycetes bacterium]|nr:dethiobiotin synthase [Planctomycetota bacterium]
MVSSGRPVVRSSGRLAVIGTDTGVGKSAVTLLLAQGLRALGRSVWLHKPVACGGWDGASSEDGRALRAACGDGQDPATVCPREFPEPCSPHLAAQAAGVALSLPDLLSAIPTPDPGPRTPDLLLETAGGLLAPLTADRRTNVDLLAALGWPLLLVTRPHLGTLNHTQLTVNEARRRGLRLLGLVVNTHQAVEASLAVRSAPAELAALTGLPVLAELPHGPCGDDGLRLAAAVIAGM